MMQILPSLVQAANAADFDPAVRIASLAVNGIVRVSAIAAGTYVVWFGHNTLVRGIKGDFEFSGKLYRLKGSVPGLLFVLLGTLAIGWALQAEHTGTIGQSRASYSGVAGGQRSSAEEVPLEIRSQIERHLRFLNRKLPEVLRPDLSVSEQVDVELNVPGIKAMLMLSTWNDSAWGDRDRFLEWVRNGAGDPPPPGIEDAAEYFRQGEPP